METERQPVEEGLTQKVAEFKLHVKQTAELFERLEPDICAS